MTIWLVRHAATEMTESGRFNGRPDTPLNDHGRAQARGLAARLPLDASTRIWSSPARRAVETARLAAGEPTCDERISELDFGDLEGKTWAECSSEQRAALLAFEDFAAPGGEAVAEMSVRVHAFLDHLPPGPHFVFTHGGVIRLLLRERGLDRRVEPGEIVELGLATESPGGHNR